MFFKNNCRFETLIIEDRTKCIQRAINEIENLNVDIQHLTITSNYNKTLNIEKLSLKTNLNISN